jgi:hypothetical protein
MNGKQLGAAAQQLLGAFINQFEQLGIDIPESRYVASGIVPWDGPSLTVNLGSITQGQPGIPHGVTYQPAKSTNWTASLYVQIIRPAPNLYGEGMAESMIPDADQLGRAGTQSLNDAGALTQAAVQIHGMAGQRGGFTDTGAFTGGVTGPGEGFVIGPVIPLGPEGDLSAMRITLEFSLT